MGTSSESPTRHLLLVEDNRKVLGEVNAQLENPAD